MLSGKLIKFLVILIVPVLWAVEPTTISPYGRCLTYSAPVGQKLSPDLKTILDTLSTGVKTQVIITLARQADLSGFPREAKAEMVAFLKEFARLEQADIKAYLQSGNKGISEVKPFWIFNGLVLKARRDVIEALAAREDVCSIEKNRVYEFKSRISDYSNTPFTTGPLWNLDKIGAYTLWSEGYTGEGIVIGNIDTGVNIDHPALAGKWRGEGQSDPENHWYDAVAGETEPFDGDKYGGGHGTMTMGVMCGGNGPINGVDPNDIGVAPGVKFVCARACSAWKAEALIYKITDEWMSDCYQWYADLWSDDKGVDVVSVSFGDNIMEGLTVHWFILRNLRDLGTIPVCAVGNQYEDPLPVARPANYPVVIGVGSSIPNEDVAAFSCRGPAPQKFPYTVEDDWGRPDWNFHKPDILAPGEDIRTSYFDFNGYVYEYGYRDVDGTSFSAPQVAGAIALMLQAKPDLAYKTIYNTLLDNSYRRGNVIYPNNDYGWGRLDAYQAVHAALQSPPTWDSWSPHATAFNANRHLSTSMNDLVYPPGLVNMKYHLAYESNNKILYTYWTDWNPLPWFQPEIIDNGEYPTLTTRENPLVLPSTPYVGIAFIDDKFPYLRLRNLEGYWESRFPFINEEDPLPDPFPNIPADSFECSPVSGTFGSYVLAGLPPRYMLTGAGVFSLRWLHTLSTNPLISSYIVFVKISYDPALHEFWLSTPVILDSYEADQFCGNPCLAITPGDTFHVVWEKYTQTVDTMGMRYYKTDIYYKTSGDGINWPPTAVNISRGAQGAHDYVCSSHPFVEAYGDRVYVTWTEGPILIGGTRQVGVRYRHLRQNFWYPDLELAPDPLSAASKDADFPSKSTYAYTTWMERDDQYMNKWDLHWYYKPDEGELEEGILESDDPDSNARFCQSCSWVGRDGVTFANVWTQNDRAPFEIKSDTKLLEWYPPQLANSVSRTRCPLDYYRITLGDSLPSPYCQARAGYKRSSNHKVDYGPQLIYELPYLDQTKFYLLRAIVYAESLPEVSASDYTQRFTFDALNDTTITYQPGIPETLYTYIQPGLYWDTQVLLKVTGTSKAPASVDELTVYQYDWVDPQLIKPRPTGLETTPSRRVISFEVTPNPFGRTVEIRFQTTGGRQPMTLKVYNISGQMVRDFSNALSLKPGVYAIRWDGSNDRGQRLSNGVYFLKLETGLSTLTRKVVLIK